MDNSEVEIDAYELLTLTPESTDHEIRTAYRKLSLKVHPDRNRGNPDAARKFHELNQAYEMLLDPLRRMALDAKLRLKQAKAQRYEKYDSKRKVMVEELEERERAFKKAKMNQQKEEAARWHETEKIKEEGKRLREERQRAMQEREREREAVTRQAEQETGNVPSVGALDTTVRVKFNLLKNPTLTTTDALSALLSQFGETDTASMVLSLKPPKKAPTKPPKFGTALVPYKQLSSALGAVSSSGRPERGLEGIDITWAGGSEPPILDWLKKQGKLAPLAVPSMPPASRDAPKAELPQAEKSKADSGTPFSTFPSFFPDLSTAPPIPETPASMTTAGMDYESLTLLRMRQAERERLEREIREQEEEA
ncbi:DnaJ domain-containing protein [Schizophyllum amplum]|uniref:DnaJ domain-containing protein n=1 Tax=Schizophyllum amplum TaxID=97359 RepID=A0A550CBX8_9AGAR|nr:DnaJ domain-containing protein [Auriculariopsis ampla]